ncbi:SRPBCC family protein [Streptomyces corynorhini]|uniref:Polyketide cyclase/dehydrase n=1 Tax=Streptomyces corynorhini TaxID=2282652 RepID=A0A370BBR6_9ACTN|nr:SRPBCC family protein [Streptomyces corynorhini]RDG37819.1 polyketide cyclase/dehydrase [Streptomyces corynorhini]
MRVYDSPRRPTAKAAATIAAAVTLAITLGGCGSGDDSEAKAQDSKPSTASVTDSPGQAQDNQCGGKSTDPDAALTRSSDIDIDAPVERVWDVHTDVVKWKEWQDAVLTIERLDSGAFSGTSRFRWTTPVPKSQFAPADTLTITSSVQHVESGSCVIWEGPAKGKAITIDKGTHLWVFTETDKGTHVHTQESWDAPLLDSLRGADRDAVADMLGGGLDVWLKELKAKAEGPAS